MKRYIELNPSGFIDSMEYGVYFTEKSYDLLDFSGDLNHLKDYACNSSVLKTPTISLLFEYLLDKYGDEKVDRFLDYIVKDYDVEEMILSESDVFEKIDVIKEYFGEENIRDFVENEDYNMEQFFGNRRFDSNDLVLEFIEFCGYLAGLVGYSNWSYY